MEALRFQSIRLLAHLSKSPLKLRANLICTQSHREDTSPRRARAWTAEEDSLLLKAYKEHGADWHEVANVVHSRSAAACRQRYTLSLSPQINRQPPTAAEIARLQSLHRSLGNQWSVISQRLQTSRTPAQVYELLNNRLNPAYRSATWKEAEDELLREAILLYGESRWTLVARHVGTRSDAQCYERWTSCLKPSRRGSWTADEDTQLVNIVERLSARGEFNFGDVARELGFTRSRKSCYTRYKRLQSPQVDSQGGQE
ncbi:Myb-like protein L [Gracilariopsis chorda]|uniref:Myb-like protein L n=1 Tax=Gracilariopsis chorda TaxID=448386 RepID=A0A2V3II33_9FLOR|nr:Myb-like protein L [Gracilariopsis chorda]|eukprot:PXF41719.1 Myb-like protein L [Gracilariopsis chorda]